MLMMKRSLSLLALATALSGCMAGPDYHRPDLALTPAFHTPAAIQPARGDWWTAFGDPMLDDLEHQALAANLDLAAADARIEQARAAFGHATADLLPHGGANASAERDRSSLDTPIGAAANALGFPRSYDLYQLGGEASWEIDVAGGLRRGRQAARADLAASIDDAGAARLRITAEVADAYLTLRGLQARRAVADAQRANEAHLLDLIHQRVGEGISADREQQRTAGELAGIEASIAPLDAAIDAERNRLDVLLGTQAGTHRDTLAVAAAIPVAPDPAGSTVPADLLRRRPDILSAEQHLAASNARIGVAMAEYYPHISLSGLLGVASVSSSSLFTDGAVQAGGTAGLRWRLFDFGRVDAEVRQARGREHEALAQYRATVLHATEDVETSLSALLQGRIEVGALERQVTALTRARDQTRQAYEEGVVSLIDVIDADRALLAASDKLADAQASTARASVAAIRALGGGWEA
jgi:NodT family efflux transporter outer membrane factor (OMF) lipoprotein